MSMDKKNNPIPELTESDLRAAEAFLRAHDPGLAFPNGFSAKRGRRVVWCMEHPVLATILLHHRATAFVGAAVLLALLKPENGETEENRNQYYRLHREDIDDVKYHLYLESAGAKAQPGANDGEGRS